MGVGVGGVKLIMAMPEFSEHLAQQPLPYLRSTSGFPDSSHDLGAIVMLYHPCAPKDLVDQLRRIVVKCLRKQYFFA